MDLDQVKGRLPYASELVGVYQPLLGWQSKRTIQRVEDERVANLRVLLERLPLTHPSVPFGPNPPPDDPVFDPPGWIATRVVERLSERVRDFVSDNGRLPVGREWTTRVAPTATVRAALRDAVNELDEERQVLDGRADGAAVLSAQALRRITALDAETTQEVLTARLITTALKINPEMLRGVLARTFDWEDSVGFIDPLADVDADIRDAILAPIGSIHLYRQFFFEFDSFLGPPVGHVWLSPGGTVELVEVSTRRVLEERLIDVLTDTTTRTEDEAMVQDEIADAVKHENESNLEVGAAVSGGGGIGVWHAEGSASFAMKNSNRTAQERVRKELRQQSHRLTSEIRQSYRTSFRRVEETTDTSSKKYVLNNTTDRLVNYELRRKMRRVGVQVSTSERSSAGSSLSITPGMG